MSCDFIDLKPYLTGAVEVDGFARCFSHVDIDNLSQIQTSDFRSNIIYSYMVENIISMKGNCTAGVDRVGVRCSSTITVVASKVDIGYILNLNRKIIYLST